MEGEQLSGHGVYYQRAASADPKSRLIELRLKPEAGRFIIGSPVRVALPLAEQQTMLLPRDALVLNTEGVVYQVEQRGEELTVNRVPVTVLFGDSRQVAVSGALKQGTGWWCAAPAACRMATRSNCFAAEAAVSP